MSKAASPIELKMDELLKVAHMYVIDSFFQSDFDPHCEYANSEVVAFNDLLVKEGIKVTFVDNYGGEELGREYWSVYCFNNDDETCFVKFNGWYASYVGSEYEEYFFVHPKQKTVTYYE